MIMLLFKGCSTSPFDVVSCNDESTIYRLAERCEAEGFYARKPILDDASQAANFARQTTQILSAARALHGQSIASSESRAISSEQCVTELGQRSVAVFDYDGTLTDDVLVPMRPEMAESITSWLASGRSLVLVTNQLLNTRGIGEFFMTSLRPALQAYQQQNPSDPVHERLLLGPGAGSALFSVDANLNPQMDRPLYAHQLSEVQEQQLVDLVLERFGDDLKLNEKTGEPAYFPRGAYLSLHFPEGVDVAGRVNHFAEGLSDTLGTPYAMVAKQNASNGKQVFHIKPEHLRKSIARDYVLEKAGVERDQIVVAGDKLCGNAGDDSAMFVHGGTNLLIGAGQDAAGLPITAQLPDSKALGDLLRAASKLPVDAKGASSLATLV